MDHVRRKWVCFLSLTSFTFCLSACIGDVYYKKLNHGYELRALDSKRDMGILLSDGTVLISETVFAVGQNDRFIVVKQHPGSSVKNTNYYIIPLEKEITEYTMKEIYGPMNSEEFLKKKKELNIADLDFTIVFKDLEENRDVLW